MNYHVKRWVDDLDPYVHNLQQVGTCHRLMRVTAVTSGHSRSITFLVTQCHIVTWLTSKL
jgi:hypothetical protein